VVWQGRAGDRSPYADCLEDDHFYANRTCGVDSLDILWGHEAII